jgi:catechol 2,3-dioxygenase-like lactoylglutathione lyase family enzyme
MRMKRFHVHVSVADLDKNIRFYSGMFGSPPTVVKPDYAKWMLDDPRINFAISQRGHATGVNHLGLQVDSDAELKSLRANATSADLALHDEVNVSCCYAKSDKYWVTDPQGVAWETFHSLGTVPTYGDDAVPAPASACCPPAASAACCGPAATAESKAGSGCCA